MLREQRIGERILHKKIGLSLIALSLPIAIVLAGLSLRVRNSVEPLATRKLDDIRTEAVETFSANLTRTSQLSPPSSTADSGLFTETPMATGSVSPTPVCHGLRFVRDATILDNTGVKPAEVFTKSWLVENIGTCPWKSGYQVVLIGGIAMGGSPFKVLQDVAPGGRIQVSIKMVAPTNQSGTVEGTWKMSDEGGATFGDFMSVVVVVASPSGTPPTAAATRTP
jgi:hypothetical protein